ncbi:hypothetical protein Tco_1554564 [Tanacetum coccineum]
MLFRRNMSFHHALDLIFELDETTVKCTQAILRQRDCLDQLSEVPWVIPTFVVIEGERETLLDVVGTSGCHYEVLQSFPVERIEQGNELLLLILLLCHTCDDLSRMHSPLQSHFTVGLRVLRYLKMSLGERIQFYHGNSLGLHAFSDADWVKCLATKKFVSAEAEYKCMASTTCEVIWLTHLLKELDVEDVFLIPLEKVASGVISTVKSGYYSVFDHLDHIVLVVSINRLRVVVRICFDLFERVLKYDMGDDSLSSSKMVRNEEMEKERVLFFLCLFRSSLRCPKSP